MSRINSLKQLDKDQRLVLLKTIDVGDPAGEDDRLLEECRIETLAFSDLLADKKDLVIGPKGTGKSSLYTLFTKYLRGLLRNRKIIVVRGIAKVGAPIYTDYWSDFDRFSYEDFRNFWNILFINLIYREFVLDKELFDVTKVAVFEQLCSSNFIHLGKDADDISILKSTIERTRKLAAEGAVSASSIRGKVGIELDRPNDQDPLKSNRLVSPAKVKTREVLDFLTNYLEYYGYRIWIMLDQLDQAFERNSDVEKKALHALISESIVFNTESIKLKIFLREDVFELISEYKGIVNSDHLRMSDTLKWEKVELLRMVLKRLLKSEPLRSHFSQIVTKLDDIDELSTEDCLEIFYCLFPARGKKGAIMWDYLIRELSDGRHEVTPRDLIGLLEHAKDAQIKLISAGERLEDFFSNKAIETALSKCSKHKLQHYILSEFPYLSEAVAQLKFGAHKYEGTELAKRLGGDSQQKVKALLSVGLLQRKSEGNYFWVAPIYQRGLEVIQKRKPRRS